MVHTKGTRILWVGSKRGDEWIGKAIGNLQTYTQQHGEDKEDGHALLLEQREGTQSEGIHKTLGLTLGADRTCWQRKGIKEQNAADHTRSNKLILIGLESHQVDKPHHTDETYRTKHTNRRKVFYRIHTRKSQGIVSHRVCQSQRRHIEGHAECVNPKYHTKITGHSHIGCTKHEECSHEMTEAQQPLCRHPTVGNNTHKSRHKD